MGPAGSDVAGASAMNSRRGARAPVRQRRRQAPEWPTSFSTWRRRDGGALMARTSSRSSALASSLWTDAARRWSSTQGTQLPECARIVSPILALTASRSKRRAALASRPP